MQAELELNEHETLWISVLQDGTITFEFTDNRVGDGDKRSFTATKRKCADIHTFLGIVGATRENTEKNKKK